MDQSFLGLRGISGESALRVDQDWPLSRRGIRITRMERMARIDLVSSWVIRARDATPRCCGASAPQHAEAVTNGELIQDQMLKEGVLGLSAPRQDSIAGLASTTSSSGRRHP